MNFIFLLSLPIPMLFYMWGGQTMKWIRPVGVALSISGIFFLTHLHAANWWNGFLAWSLGFELAFGYGEKSWIAQFDKQNDSETRLIYSLWCCWGVMIAALVCHEWWTFLSVPLIIGAFQIHAGAAKFKVFGKDFLWEDFWRSLVISASMNLALGMFF